MASSKEVIDLVLVPASVIALSRRSQAVICNLRPEQRGKESAAEREYRRHVCYGDGRLISDDFERFLDGIGSPLGAAILYQGYGPEIFTAIIRLEPVICWTNDGLPRLEFDKPPNWNHCPNMWGNFVLAVAQVEDLDPTPVIADPNCEHFIEFVKQSGVPIQLTKFRRNVLFQVSMTLFQDFDHGKPIEQGFKESWNLHVGERFIYEAGSNISGMARVIAVQGNQCTIIKLS